VTHRSRSASARTACGILAALVITVSASASGQRRTLAAAISPDSTILVPRGAITRARLLATLLTDEADRRGPAYFEITMPVAANERVVIPAGTLVEAFVDTVIRDGVPADSLRVSLRVTRLIFPNDSAADARGDWRGWVTGMSYIHRINRLGNRARVGSAVAPVVGSAIGLLADGLSGAIIGGAVGTATGIGTDVVALSRSNEVVVAQGSPVDIAFDDTLVIGPRQAADGLATRIWKAADRSDRLCLRQATASTPEVRIPGTPGMPAIGDTPATPGTPDIVIPAIPGAAACWELCPG
jgi:hypothetical protein